uniref:Uncharacterized protein n=1 Tax=Rhizophora mucronata TaxID=61149 RepID=A0A2P2P503_RHIMU
MFGESKLIKNGSMSFRIFQF